MLKKIKEIKVDIILPNYNSDNFFSETINSILSQTYTNWRLIIVDDNSNTNTKETLKKFLNHPKIKIIWLKKNMGPGFCRNFAMRHSNSDYIAFIDADDIWHKDKLLEQVNFMTKNNFEFTYTDYETFKTNDRFLKEFSKTKEIKSPTYFDFDRFIKNSSLCTSSMLLKKKLIGKTKFTNTKICEDYYFKCKILKKIKYAYCLSKVLTKYRIRPGSLQSNKFKNFYWIWSINKKYNKFNFFKNLISVLYISINSLKKYGLK